MEIAVEYSTKCVVTDEETLLGRIRGIIEERDFYRGKCKRQDRILTKVVDLVTALQAFIDEEPQAEAPVIVAPVPAETPTPFSRRYTDADVLQWAEALRAGQSQTQISRVIGVSPHTISKRLAALGYNPATGYPQEKEAEPEPTVEAAPVGNGHVVETPEPDAPIYYDDDTVAKWVHEIDAGRSAASIGDMYGVSQYIVMARVRGWREEHGQKVEVYTP